jgi:hypothetical protein
MALSLPVVRGASAALYPFTMIISFLTVVSRFQNGAESRQIRTPGALIQFEIPYAKLNRAQKDTVKTAVTTAQGQARTDLTLTLGSTTYTGLSLDSDEFTGTENETLLYDAPLRLSQVVTQNLAPGTPGLPFPTLANGCMGILPYTQRKIFQTVATKVSTGPKYTTPEFGSGLTGYPTDGLMGWILDERQLSDTDLETRQAHFIANWGRAFGFPFSDEDSTTYSTANANGCPHYSTDSLSFRYNGPNNSDVKIGIELTNN